MLSIRATARQAALKFPSRVFSRTMASSPDHHPLSEIGRKHVTKGLGRVAPGVVTQAQGSYLHFSDGTKMLDFTSGIGVTNFGHCHPRISKAAADQCMDAVHIQCSIAFHEPYLDLVHNLLPMMPHPSLDSFFFWNSGSEAVEAALKTARQYTGRQNFIVMQGGYHGRTFGAMAVTRSKTIYSQGVAPLMPGVFPIPFPHWHQQGVPKSTSVDELVNRSLYQLDLILAQQSAPLDTAGILIEPVLGEGGYISVPPAFLEGLREVCDKHNLLLIIDEVQSGFGRTGKNFAIEYSGVRPDIMIMAKGLANGFPLSAVVTRKEISDKLKPGSMGGTYAGNAVSCAAAVEVTKVLKEEKILENVNARSKQLLNSLNALASEPHVAPHVLEVRGQGLMVAVEFASPEPVSTYDSYASKTTPKSMASRVAAKCIEKGLLILTTSVYEVVRFIPPLIISEEDLEKGCKVFKEAVEEVVREG